MICTLSTDILKTVTWKELHYSLLPASPLLWNLKRTATSVLARARINNRRLSQQRRIPWLLLYPVMARLSLLRSRYSRVHQLSRKVIKSANDVTRLKTLVPYEQRHKECVSWEHRSFYWRVKILVLHSQIFTRDSWTEILRQASHAVIFSPYSLVNLLVTSVKSWTGLSKTKPC